jgi:hypothetical protein
MNQGLYLNMNHKMHSFNDWCIRGFHCLVTLKALEKFISAKPLIFQMDNCVKDNNNCHFLAFLFFTIARKMFEMKLRFLVVGPTHEDIEKKLDIFSRN